MKNKRNRFFLLILISFVLTAGCIPKIELSTPTPSATLAPISGKSHPGKTAATATLSLLSIGKDRRLTPTPTPVIYTVKQNDTFIGIAEHFGVDLHKLIQANPDINPKLLSIGITLTIPMGDVIQKSIPSPTPLPLSIQKRTCYKTSEPGIICFFTVKNTFSEKVDNITLQALLFDDANKKNYKVIASSPVNILPPAKSFPLVAHFHDVTGKIDAMNIELQTALPVDPEDTRYIPVETEITQTISSDGMAAVVTGRVVLPKDAENPAKVQLAVFAYDHDENPVGYRKLTIENIDENTKEVPFSMTVYSLGQPIETVTIWGEGLK